MGGHTCQAVGSLPSNGGWIGIGRPRDWNMTAICFLLRGLNPSKLKISSTAA
jgi:hypothetical protein